MRNLDESNLTEAVIASMANARDARIKEILSSLIQHLHAFIRDVNLTEEEWMAGIQFLTDTGHICDDRRQEFILLSDTLGVTTLKDFVNNRKPPGVTEYTILGPFHRSGAPNLPLGDNIAAGIEGEPVVVKGQVRTPDRKPISNARLDVWQADANGFYDLQMQGVDGMALRGIFHTDSDGRFIFTTIKPSSYPIPYDGPVGKMLNAMSRHPYRPAHIHFIVTAEGYKGLTTELFAEGDPYLESDAVFGVKESLIVPFVRSESKEEAASFLIDTPFYKVDYDFVMEPA